MLIFYALVDRRKAQILFHFFCLGMKGGGGGLPLRIPAADETSAAVQAAMHYADLLCTVMCFNTRSSGNKSGHFTPKPHTRFNFTWLKINLFQLFFYFCPNMNLFANASPYLDCWQQLKLTLNRQAEIFFFFSWFVVEFFSSLKTLKPL